MILESRINPPNKLHQVSKKIWNWSEVSDYHNAVVKVETRTGAGTGVIFDKSGSKVLVISAAHVIGREDTGTIECGRSNSTKEKAQFTVVGRNDSLDVCFLLANMPNDSTFLEMVTPIPLELSVTPTAGQKVEILGLGGPEDGLRHFWTNISSVTSNNLELAGYVTEGDSGGGVILYTPAGPKVIGVVTGGETVLPTTSGFNLVGPIFTSNPNALQITYTQCGVGGCFPQQPGFQQPGWGPPQKPYIPAPIQPPVIQPCECDHDKLVADTVTILIQRIKLDVELQLLLKGDPGNPGEPGQPGIPGTPGTPGTPGEPCEIDYEELIGKLPPIYIPAQEGTIEVYLGDELPPMRFIVTTETGVPTQEPVIKHLSELVTIRLVPKSLTDRTKIQEK